MLSWANPKLSRNADHQLTQSQDRRSTCCGSADRTEQDKEGPIVSRAHNRAFTFPVVSMGDATLDQPRQINAGEHDPDRSNRAGSGCGGEAEQVVRGQVLEREHNHMVHRRRHRSSLHKAANRPDATFPAPWPGQQATTADRPGRPPSRQ